MNSTFIWRGFAATHSSMRAQALLSVDNISSKNLQITIEKFDISPVSPSGAAGTLETIAVRRISACSDGESVTVVSSSPTVVLPSQVQCKLLPQIIPTADLPFSFRTISGDDRSNLNYSNYVFQFHIGKIIGSSLLPKGTLAAHNHVNTQGIVIREGEGWAICKNSDANASINSRVHMQIGYVVFIDDLGNSFTSQFELVGSEALSKARFAIFNGVGSGRTYAIVHAEYIPVGTDHFESSIYHRVRAYIAKPSIEGEIVTPIASSPGTILPTDVVIKRCRISNPMYMTHQLNPELARTLNVDGLQVRTAGNSPYSDSSRNQGMFHAFSPGGRGNAGLGQTGFQNHNNGIRYGLRNMSSFTQPITINNGQSFVLVPDNLSTFIPAYGFATERTANYHAYWIELTISVSTGAVASAHA